MTRHVNIIRKAYLFMCAGMFLTDISEVAKFIFMHTQIAIIIIFFCQSHRRRSFEDCVLD